MEDKLLLYKVVAKKDPEAYGRLYDKYVDSIYRFIFFRVKTQEEAEDITSDVFLKAWQYLVGEKENKVDNFRAFLYRVARNAVIDFYRKRKDDIPLEGAVDLVDDQIDIIESLDLGAEMEFVWESMEELKEEYKEIIVLKHIEGLSISEIAEIVNKKSGATRVLLHRAMNTLKKIVKAKTL